MENTIEPVAFEAQASEPEIIEVVTENVTASEVAEEEPEVIPEPLEPLIPLMTGILTNLGHPDPSKWEQYIPKDAEKYGDDESKRFFINRGLRDIFSEVPDDKLPETQNARYVLVDGECAREDYLRIFETGVAPCLIKLQLPIVKS